MIFLGAWEASIPTRQERRTFLANSGGKKSRISLGTCCALNNCCPEPGLKPALQHHLLPRREVGHGVCAVLGLWGGAGSQAVGATPGLSLICWMAMAKGLYFSALPFVPTSTGVSWLHRLQGPWGKGVSLEFLYTDKPWGIFTKVWAEVRL